jgi:undecaprenyl-diphosphatase
VRRRLRGPWNPVAALTVAFAATSIGFGGLTEDVTRHDGQQRFDLRRLDWVVGHRTHLEVRLAQWLSHFGAASSMALVAVVATAALWRRRQSAAIAIAPFAAIGLAAVATSAAKLAVGRVRPPAAIRLVADTDPSFPSGHTTATTAVMVTLAAVLAVAVLRRPLARAAAVAGGVGMAVAIGVSRLVLAAHWPTDVAAGWLLGSAVATLVLAVVVVVSPRVPSGPELWAVVRERWTARRTRRARVDHTTSLSRPAAVDAGTR